MAELAAEYGGGIAVLGNGGLHDPDKIESQVASGDATLAIARSVWPKVGPSTARARRQFDIFEPLHKMS